ncbi:MAG: 4-hydroxy-2-oxovalerate aldolase [Gammaproteobacteria bacterium]|nr:4-hydroxy-2-oxovalerate aldolase [Gammaproteobacteria bacterium]MCY4209881.1 4-hydroxy-2-oxovalerate aldolase [Gammaproteobacteria bacterium]MCY4338887.1 4-hydroxy-2-oxovalerate aldolase [Gammaproteobacteria bacterium]
MNLSGKTVKLHDMCLRDGMHAKRHQISVEQMINIATALDEAGVHLIEVTHGDGLGGASINYGFPAGSDEEYLRAVTPRMTNARISALLLPGIGTVEHLHLARDCGVHTLRVATHCTEADVAEQHIGVARKLGLDTVGFLMMAHMVEPEQLLEQGRLLEAYGANCIYCTDSAGYMLPDDVTARIAALRAGLSAATEIGFHGHHNLALGIANSLAAVEAGADRIDGSAAGLGAGAGNTPLEVFNAVLHRMGVQTGVDVFKLMNVAEDVVVPMMDQLLRVDRDSLIMGYAGVYSSFLLHAKRVGAKYDIPSEDILVELGKLKTIGGQEDMIEDVALNLARVRQTQPEAV